MARFCDENRGHAIYGIILGVTPGELVRKARYEAGCSQRDVVELLRLHRRARRRQRESTTQSYVSRLEGDAFSPRVETLSEVLNALGYELVLDIHASERGKALVDRRLAAIEWEHRENRSLGQRERYS